MKGPRRSGPGQAIEGGNVLDQGGGLVRRRRRKVGVTTGTWHWSKAGEALVPIVRVYVKDLSGTDRDEHCYSTDPTMTAVARMP